MNGYTKQTNIHNTLINGNTLYYSFLAGANQILQHQIEINKINVFPVDDKDTGTNLAATVRSVLDNIKPNKSYKTTVNDIAEAALFGARGNSGVIFAQFLYGISCETKNKPRINVNEFVESIDKSIPYIYKAISNPVEGTMLTVIKEWSGFLNSKKESIHNFKDIIIDSFSVLEKSLSETTFKLKVLNKTGFVDAGAKGFVLFIKGIIDFIKNGDIQHPNIVSQTNSFQINDKPIIDNKISFHYCTEAIIKNLNINNSEIQKTLKKYGDSIVIAGSKNICRIHIHTNNPEELFLELKKYGTITFQKVDDMIKQKDIATNRKWKIALVTDSTCDLAEELIDYYQINVVPLNLSFGENHFLDKVTIKPDRFYNMLESEEEFPKTSQINEQTFINLYSHLATYYDSIISIHLTSNFSGTFNNSLKAGERVSKEFHKPIYVIDSKNLSGALGLLVLKAAQYIENGKAAEEIIKMLTKDILQTKIYVSVRDLKYMIRGGRVSKRKGFIAKLLGCNPIVSMNENGKSMLFGNTFNQQSSLKKIINHIKNISKNKTIWNYIILHAHNPEEAKKTEIKMMQLTGKKSISIVDISPVIGMHAGIGSIAISLLLTN